MSTTATHETHELRWLVPTAVIAALLPFAAVLAGIRYTRESAFWWLILAVSVFTVAFPLVVRGLVSLMRGPDTRERY